jgi:SAM-dependent methyltransferase
LLPPPRYETIGRGYARLRREDPRLRERIRASLGDARSVLNVGAGAGSYEPRDLYVLAVEPSDVMAAQRLPELAPAIRASAGAIPLRDASVDAAMAILTLHHWDEDRECGVRELRRVARDRVVILTYDARVWSRVWLISDYLPEIGELDSATFPAPELIASWLGGSVRIETVPLSRDTPDWMLGSYWAHPERVLDADARAVTSGFARLPAAVVDRAVTAIARDLEDGTWSARHGMLRQLEAYDVGLRLIVAQPG